MTAPVLLVFYSRSRMPESVALADDLATAGGRVRGPVPRRLVDVDAAPQIAQAMQIPSVPLVLVVLDGRPAAAAPGRAPARRAPDRCSTR